jgi:UDP-galactopyranose mutase
LKQFLQRILQEIIKKMILGTSDAWSMSHLSQKAQQTFVLYCGLSDFIRRKVFQCCFDNLGGRGRQFSPSISESNAFSTATIMYCAANHSKYIRTVSYYCLLSALVYTDLWANFTCQTYTYPYTWFLPRPAKNESNIPKQRVTKILLKTITEN